MTKFSHTYRNSTCLTISPRVIFLTVNDFSVTPFLFCFRHLSRTTESVLITCILGCIHLNKLTFSQLKKVKIIFMTGILDLLNRPEIFSHTYENLLQAK